MPFLSDCSSCRPRQSALVVVLQTYCMGLPGEVVVVRLPPPTEPLSVPTMALHLQAYVGFQNELPAWEAMLYVGSSYLLVPSIARQVLHYLPRRLVDAIVAVMAQGFEYALLVEGSPSLCLLDPVLRFPQSCDYRRYQVLRRESPRTGDQDFPHRDRGHTRGLLQNVAVGRTTALPSKGICSEKTCSR